ncbi:MAG: hypothetical protein EOO47_18550 [Flavobacterium sp.]|nr:MAG: hypothetical protein EOO47_18550 [Flavobacterium sp.]
MQWSEVHKMDVPAFPAWAATATKTSNRIKINPVEKRGYHKRRTTAAPFRKRKLAYSRTDYNTTTNTHFANWRNICRLPAKSDHSKVEFSC